MKVTILVITAIAVITFAIKTIPAQTPSETIRVRGCLLGNGSTENPWSLKGVVLPAPPTPAPAGPAGRGGGGRGRGDGAGRGAPPVEDGRGTAGAGRADGNRGAAAETPAPSVQPSQPPMDLRLTGIDMSPWRNMFVEVEGTLGQRPASGLRDLQVSFAHSAYGDCR